MDVIFCMCGSIDKKEEKSRENYEFGNFQHSLSSDDSFILSGKLVVTIFHPRFLRVGSYFPPVMAMMDFLFSCAKNSAYDAIWFPIPFCILTTDPSSSTWGTESGWKIRKQPTPSPFIVTRKNSCILSRSSSASIDLRSQGLVIVLSFWISDIK